MFKDKKQAKVVALAVVAFFVLGVVGIAVSQTGKTYAAGAPASNVGIVSYQQLVQSHPDFAKMQEAMKAETTTAQQDFDAKGTTMSDKEKQAYFMQVQERLNVKQRELLTPIYDKIDAAIKATADARGLSVVLEKDNVIYGGQNITEDVMKKITGK